MSEEMTWQEVATLMRDALHETAAQLATALAQVSALRVKLEELTVRLSVLPEEDKFVTKTGKVLTNEDIEALADEAERGYDVSSFAELTTRERTSQKRWEAREQNGNGEQDEVELDGWRAQRLRNALSTLQATGAAEGTQVSVEVGPNQYCSYTQAELLHLLHEEGV